MVPDEAWRLSETPTLQIGVEEGEDVYQLYRITSALRVNGGSDEWAGALVLGVALSWYRGPTSLASGRHGYTASASRTRAPRPDYCNDAGIWRLKSSSRCRCWSAVRM